MGSDARLRELERRAAQGEPGAREQLLRERLRAGALSRAQLRLAAAADDAAAAAVLEADGGGGAPLALPEAPVVRGAFAEWLEGLRTLDPRALLWALVGGGELGLRPFARLFGGDERPAQALSAARAWLEGESEERALAAHEAAQAAQASVSAVSYWLVERHKLGMFTQTERTALEYVGWTARDAALGAFQLGCATAELPSADSLVRLEASLVGARWAAPGGVRAAAGSAVAAWALAEGASA